MGDNERAADLLQDTFVRALAALDLAAPPDDVRAVDPRTQQELWRATLPPGFTALDENVATSPDGRWLYVVVFQHDEANPPSLPVEVSSVAKMLLVIDATTGQVQSQPIALPESIQLPHLMTPGSGTTVYLFDRQLYPFNTATQQLEQSIPVPASWPRAALINAVFPSRDGRQLYVLGDTHRVAIFDIEQQVYVAERVLAAPSYVGHGGVWAASSPNGTYIVVASNFKPPLQDGVPIGDDNTRSELMVYDVETWQLVHRVPSEREVYDITMSADGTQVYAVATPPLALGEVTFSSDPNTVPIVPHSILTFDVATGQIQNEYAREGESIWHIFVGP